jgi:hypothetical protein
MEKQKVSIVIWNGIIDSCYAPENVEVTIKDYDKHCDCGNCLKDKDGDRYHEQIFFNEHHTVKPQ